MSDSIRVSSLPVESQGELYLHTVIKNGETTICNRFVAVNDADQVTAILTEAANIAGRNAAAVEQQLADSVIDAKKWWKSAKESDLPGFRPKLLTTAELETLDVRHRWLIKNVLVCDQPALLGGPKKSMKTTAVIDMAISLGTGTPFLNKFDVPERVTVAVFSGESGESTIKETVTRICRAKGVAMSECSVIWGFDLPGMGVEADLQGLSTILREKQVKVVFIDPAYVCLLNGSPETQASNMFQVGPLLRRVAKVCQEAGATLVLVHHTTKNASMNKIQTGEPLELEDLAYAGFQEFARQWVLVNRRRKYEPGSGKHQLWLNLGGSAGHSGCWGIDIDEGPLREDFGGRFWSLKVRSMDETMKSMKQEKEEAKAGPKKAKVDQLKRRILGLLLQCPRGETVKRIHESLGVEPSPVKAALAELKEEGRVVICEIEKPGGRGNRPYSAWKLITDVECVQNRPMLPIAADNDDEEDNLASVLRVGSRESAVGPLETAA